MAGDVQSEMKILITVAQESKAALLGVATDFKTILDNVKHLDAASLAQLKQQIDNINTSSSGTVSKMAELESGVNKLMGAVRFLAGGFLALESVRFLKGIMDTAARTQELGTVMHVAGNQIGYTNEQLDAADKATQKQGITAQVSRQAITRHIQANLDLGNASKLASAAQNLATVSGQNSSQTYEMIVAAVQRHNSYILHMHGIMINEQLAEEKYAKTIGTTAHGLDEKGKSQATANAVIEYATTVSG